MSKVRILAGSDLVGGLAGLAGIAGITAAVHIGQQAREMTRADMYWEGRALCRDAVDQFGNKQKIELVGKSGNRFVCERVFNEKGQPIIKIGTVVVHSDYHTFAETVAPLGELNLQVGY